MPTLPSGLVTFMFTDIVGSAEMKGKMSGDTSGERQDAFRDTVKSPHDDIVIERVNAHGGCVVKDRGDGFMIAFADAEKAVICGVEIQQRIGAASIATPEGVLQIRIGLNSGHAKPVANDYIASAVDKAARVEPKAIAGHVYLSRETHELVRGKVRGIRTASAGSFDMKGIGREELFVASPANSSVLAPPAAISAKHSTTTTIPNNLPSLQPFFGREKELATIRDALDPESRTWGTLIDGPRGMGKTSLAVHTAYNCSPGQFQRIIYVSLKTRELDATGIYELSGVILRGLIEMLNELARELGHPDIANAPEERRLRLLLDALRPAQALLILDNLEYLPKPDRSQLFTFIKRLPQGCKAILTSHDRIGFDSELLTLDKLEQAAAIETLADLAKRNPWLAKTSEAERIALYKQTGGNPLLLRWVAGQLGRKSFTTIDHALAHLRSCPQDNDPLEFIFGDLAKEFSPDETSVLAALTYFTLPATVAHITVPTGIAAEQLETVLRALANRSLVVPDQEEKTFSLVPMVADFIRRKRPEVIAETGVRLEKHAFALIEENGNQRHDHFPALTEAWPIVAAALPNFLAGPNDRLQNVCRAIRFFLEFSGRWDEWRSLWSHAENSAAAAGDRENAGKRAFQLGWFHYRHKSGDAILDCAERAAKHWATNTGQNRDSQSGVRERASVMLMRGLGYRSKRLYKESIGSFREALALFTSLSPESIEVAICLNGIGTAERHAGRLDEAQRHLLEALSLARRIPFQEGIASYTSGLARIAIAREDWPAAERLARESLPLSEAIGREELVARACLRLAIALKHQGKSIEALPYARRAVELYTHLRSPDLEFACTTLRECEK